MKTELHFSSKSDSWSTPQKLFDDLNDEFHFTLDPCSDGKNNKCEKFFTKIDDGLSQDWRGHTVFMNPPYGREIKKWMKKAKTESENGATVVCLVPSRTDTAWWHDNVIMHEVRFIRGRLKFNGHKNNAPFPSAIVVMRGVK